MEFSLDGIKYKTQTNSDTYLVHKITSCDSQLGRTGCVGNVDY